MKLISKQLTETLYTTMHIPIITAYPKRDDQKLEFNYTDKWMPAFVTYYKHGSSGHSTPKLCYDTQLPIERATRPIIRAIETNEARPVSLWRRWNLWKRLINKIISLRFKIKKMERIQ
jgi:hypothetical protein